MRSKDTLLRLHRFRYDEKRRQVGEIEAMIADFRRKQDDLDLQIQAEEERSGVSDPEHFNYSMTAKALRGRRDNLLRSIHIFEVCYVVEFFTESIEPQFGDSEPDGQSHQRCRCRRIGSAT